MNKRIDVLIAQATLVTEPDDPDYRYESFDKRAFAELIIQDCLSEAMDEVQYHAGWDVADLVAKRIKEHFGIKW